MLPETFRKVHLELAREPGHPEGDARHGYDLLIPLDDDGRIDAAAWRQHRAQTRIRRFRPGEADLIGVLARKPGGSWYFDYAEGDGDNEAGFRFGDEAFIPGEYVSIRENDGGMHTFRIIAVEQP
ncbi:MAG: hypothetical protein ACWA6X_08155 [Bauldia sp.]|jgi:hypothetical protein